MLDTGMRIIRFEYFPRGLDEIRYPTDKWSVR